MDKSWITERNKFSTSYVNGVKSFINLAKQNVLGRDNLIRCPCVICNNAFYKSLDEVEYDLHVNGFKQTYVEWIFHGETPNRLQERERNVDMNDTHTNVGEASNSIWDELDELLEEIGEAQQANDVNEENTTNFSKLLEDSQRELYPGCRMSLLSKAHCYILSNCDEVEPYIKMQKAELQGIGIEDVGDSTDFDETQQKMFPKWFKDRINLLHLQKPEEVTRELWCLANGPSRLYSSCYNGCIVNEVRFHTRDRDAVRRTQNSGIVVEGTHKNQPMEYFGFLKRVIELSYIGSYKVVLFECEWFDTGSKKTMQVDKYFTSVDVSSRWYKNDPFVLPIQVQQVFYINDTKLGKNWQIVERVRHRHLWDLPELEATIDVDGQVQARAVLQQYESSGVDLIVEVNNEGQPRLSRDDVEPEVVDELAFRQKKKSRTGKARDRAMRRKSGERGREEQNEAASQEESEDEEEEDDDEAAMEE
ncbi:hypothetical protein OROHE_000983 [Orobanche hederae]